MPSIFEALINVWEKEAWVSSLHSLPLSVQFPQSCNHHPKGHLNLCSWVVLRSSRQNMTAAWKSGTHCNPSHLSSPPLHSWTPGDVVSIWYSLQCFLWFLVTPSFFTITPILTAPLVLSSVGVPHVMPPVWSRAPRFYSRVSRTPRPVQSLHSVPPS